MNPIRIIAGAALALSLTLTSCDKAQESPVLPDEQPTIELANGTFELLSPSLEPGSIAEENNLFVVREPASDRRVSPIEALRCFITELTPEQRRMISAALNRNGNCISQAVTALRNSERQITARFNEQLRALRASAVAGEISREEFARRQAALQARLRETLINNPMRERAQAMIENCHKATMDAIRETLTPEQQRIWDDCVNNGNCCTPDRTQPDRTQPDRTQPDRTQPDRTQPDRTQPDRDARPQ